MKLTYRKLKNINTTTFGYDITNALANQYLKGMSLEENIALYNSLLQRTVDILAPLTTKVIIRNKIPWFSDNIREQIQLWCKLERKWSHDKSNGDKFILFYTQRRAVSNLLDTTERDYYQYKLFQNKSNYKEAYNNCNALLGRTKVSPLLPTSLPQQQVDELNEYFTNKNILICEKLFSTILDLEEAGLTKPTEH